MLYTVTTGRNTEDVKNEIESKAKEVGFGLLKEYKFKEILKSKGHPIERDITVYELCNPAAAQAILDIHPEVSVYLPCRVSIYKDGDKTIISTIRLEDILRSFELENEYKAHMQDIFDKLKKLIANLE